MAVSNISFGFGVSAAEPIDTRLCLSKTDMLAVNDKKMPAKYFAVCTDPDDLSIYLYDKEAEIDPASGRYRKLKAGGGDIDPELENRVATLEAKLPLVEGKVDNLEIALEAILPELAAINEKLLEIEAKIANYDTKFDEIDANITDINTNITNINDKLINHDSKFIEVSDSILTTKDYLNGRIDFVDGKVSDLLSLILGLVQLETFDTEHTQVWNKFSELDSANYVKSADLKVKVIEALREIFTAQEARGENCGISVDTDGNICLKVNPDQFNFDSDKRLNAIGTKMNPIA